MNTSGEPPLSEDEQPSFWHAATLVGEDGGEYPQGGAWPSGDDGDGDRHTQAEAQLRSPDDADDPLSTEQTPATPPRTTFQHLKSFVGRTLHYTIVTPARLLCLVTLLGALSVIPMVQLAVLGYMLEISGRLARGERFRDSLILLPEAGRLGLAALAIYLWTLPIQLLGYYAYAAELIEPGNPRTFGLRTGAIVVVAIAFGHVTWALTRGGKLSHYLWPQPIRFLKNAWRPSFWSATSDRLWEFLVSLHAPRLLWLGFRGAIGSLAWIILPALILIGATRNGETGLAGFIGFVGLLMMGFVVMYLPMLQVQFAADNRLRSMFAWRTVRRNFRNAPIAFWLGTTATLVLAIPLYLLKIEATPREVVWLTSLVFVAFMLPAHLVTGWATRRALHREAGTRWWHRVVRWNFRLLTLPIVFFYLFIVYLSQLTSWDGLATWIQQHAFLVPVPYVGV
jgi:hypothetical protein